MPGSHRAVRCVGALATAALMLWSAEVVARGSGVAGVAQSPTGCSCHGSSANQNGAVTVDISGSQYVAPGSTNSYTISATGGPAGTTGGVDLKATGGTLVQGTGTYILSGDLVHSSNAQRSWTFSWQAPAIEGTYSFYAIGMCSDGSSNSGDSWNWYGGAVNTPFSITVTSAAGVGDGAPGGLWLAPVTPNPSRGAMAIAFALPVAGSVTLGVYDLSGRLVSRLLAGPLPAGNRSVAWSGRNLRGDSVPSGRYIIRLTVGGRTLSRSVTILR
jgi:hypothetical protein